MNTKDIYTYRTEEDGKYLGHLNEYPDHWTQGDDFNDLKEHLLGLYQLFSAEQIIEIKKVDERIVA